MRGRKAKTMDWFRFRPEGWFYNGIAMDLNPEQIVAYMGLLSACAMRKSSHDGYIAWDNNTPPTHPRHTREMSMMFNCTEDVLKQTIRILVKTGRLEVETNGIMRFIKWDFIYPVANKQGYNSGFNNQVKKRIKERDNYICQRCGISEDEYKNGAKSKKGLVIHHIDYDKLHIDDPNLISLCVSCHTAVNTNKEYWTKVFQNKLTKFYGTVVEVK
jgi:hypothetical protein